VYKLIEALGAFIAGIAIIGGAILLLVAIIGYPVMWLWNGVMPAIFGLPTITFWQAVCLAILCQLLFHSHTMNSSKNS
jgi:hypothetical protein